MYCHNPVLSLISFENVLKLSHSPGHKNVPLFVLLPLLAISVATVVTFGLTGNLPPAFPLPRLRVGVSASAAKSSDATIGIWTAGRDMRFPFGDDAADETENEGDGDRA